MHILMVTEDIPTAQVGGLGKHVVTLANAMIAAGHDVDLMGRSERDYAPHADEIGFHGRFLPGFDFSHVGWKEKQLGVFLPPKRSILAHRIARAINAVSDTYEVVHYHGHLPMVGNFVKDGINFVQTRHDQGSECLTHLRFKDGHVCNEIDPAKCAACIHPKPGFLRSAVSATAVRRYRRETADCFAKHKTIFVSDFLARKFLLAAPAANLNRSWVIHNFIDLKRLREASNDHSGLPQNLVLAGRIDMTKGFSEFLAEAVNKIPDGVQIDIIGDGPERAVLERRYANKQVKFLGWRPYDEVIRRTRAARSCAVPSIWEEPFGATTLEALVMGRPCVALAQGGTPELTRYQRHDGQLQLAHSMAELVSIAFDQFKNGYREDSAPESCEADVHSTMKAILEVYAA